MTDAILSPAAALALLDRYAGAYQKTARATRAMVIDQGRMVAEVYAACEVAGVTAAKWLDTHWGVSGNTARNWLRMYEHRDAIPESCAPSTAYFLFSPSIGEDQEAARDYILDLMDQGVKLTDTLVKQIMRRADLSESIALVAGHLRARNAKPKDILNELDAIAQVANRWREEGLAFSPDFTAEVNQIAEAQRHERDNVVYTSLRVVNGHFEPTEPLPLREGAIVQAQLTLGKMAA